MNRSNLPARSGVLAACLIPLALLASACSSSSATTKPEATAVAANPTSSAIPATTNPATSSAAATSAAQTTGSAGAEPTPTDSVLATPDTGKSVRLLAYEAFVEPEALAAFTKATGIAVTVARAGDTGTMVNKALLTKGNPEGDVLWGLDNVLLSRAVGDGLFEPYVAADLGQLDPATTALVPGHEVTPVDTGDVCVNYDIAWFADHKLAPPATLDDLTSPTYKNLLVVENPASSSPGLAFLLGTVAKYGETGWAQYWTRLKANGVLVVDSWDAAYVDEFTQGGGAGTYPLVVSYASSPPYALIVGDPPLPTEPTTASIDTTCFRQVEFAGVLTGAKHPAEAKQLIDFLIGETFQSQLPATNFVYPVRNGVALPDAFVKFGAPATAPLTIAPDVIAANRDGWIEDWTKVVIG